MWAQKIVTLPRKNFLRIRMLHREKPYERYFEKQTANQGTSSNQRVEMKPKH